MMLVEFFVCNKCNLIKEGKDFPYGKTGKRAGYRYKICRLCETKRRNIYNEKHPEVRKKASKGHYQRNTAKRIEGTTQWRKDNPERYKILAARSYKKHIVVRRLNSLLYKKNNRAYYNLLNRKRNKKIKNPTKNIKQNDIDRLYINQRGKCIVCKKLLRNSYHIDHIMPIARGGIHSIENLQLLCASCNISKNARDPIEFMQSRGFLL